MGLLSDLIGLSCQGTFWPVKVISESDRDKKEVANADCAGIDGREEGRAEFGSAHRREWRDWMHIRREGAGSERNGGGGRRCLRGRAETVN